METFVVLNSAKCKSCGEVLISRHRHDFVTCKCKEDPLSIDGGLDYIRIVNKDKWIDLSISSEVDINKYGSENSRGKEVYVPKTGFVVIKNKKQ